MLCHARAKKADFVGPLDLEVVKAETVCVKVTGWEVRLCPVLVTT